MKYMKAAEQKPHDGVDVFVVTYSGKKGIARFWSNTRLWLTTDINLKPYDEVIKWKYADAKVIK